MKVNEIVNELNAGKKRQEIADLLNISSDTVSKRLKAIGYTYNQKTKVYEFKGSDVEKNEIESKDFSDFGRANGNSKVRRKSEKIPKDKLKPELVLTEDEIKFIKEFYHSTNRYDKQFEISWERSKLPAKKPEKKVPYIISEKTYQEFKEFSDEMENDYRITQNELVEIALRKFIRDFR